MNQPHTDSEFRKTVIIVEDNENVAKMVATTLLKEGYNSKVLSYGSAAVFYALDHDDCLLLMEYYLPDMTAKDVIEGIHHNQKSVPFIIMSAPGDEKAIIEMMKLGARDYLIKEQGFMDILPISIAKALNQIGMEERLVRTQKSLQNSEGKFKDIFDGITDAVYIYEIDGIMLEMNKAALNRLRVKDQINQYNFFEFHEIDFIQHHSSLVKRLETVDVIQYETYEIDTLDQMIPVDCYTKVIDYDSRSVFMTISRDISQKKVTESLLRQSEERYQRITNTMTDYIYTVYINNDQVVETVHSNECEKVTGYSVQELHNNKYLWIDMVDKLDRDMVLGNVQRLLNGKNIKPYEHRIVKKNGQKAWLRNIPVLHFDDHGKLLFYDGVIQDITQQKLFEEKLLEKRSQLKSLLNTFPGYIYVTTDEYKLEYVNKNFVRKIGYDPTGETCYRSIFNQNEICPWCVNQKVLNGESVKQELQLPESDNWYSFISSPVYHQDGRRTNQTILIDATEKKFADYELNRLNTLYFSLVAEIDYPVCRFNEAGDLLSANSAFYEVFSLNSKTGKNRETIYSFLPVDLANWTKNSILRLKNNKDTLKNKTNLDSVKHKKPVTWVVKAVMGQTTGAKEYLGILMRYNLESFRTSRIEKSV